MSQKGKGAAAPAKVEKAKGAKPDYKGGSHFRLAKPFKRMMATIRNQHERGFFRRLMIDAQKASVRKISLPREDMAGAD